ncbi:LLM class flavin-dependent oxidoreductase [Segeticoccus rhizosphaerae]|uniref:LLM class flavin-dependent oxidoreductase n=1 Tax=Segeticoccus rhizosphaerae TaxID=1104777 RepID=UPI0010BFB3C2|nr:LLM class flavin-dependent oxidoreductase [Ornithinicoccus soli]
MKPIEVSIRVPLGRPLPELAAFAARCERAGLDGVGVPDHHHTGRDAYLALSAMAYATDRIALFPATSNVVTRHPLVLASLVNSLDELAPGRAFVTVAPGFLSVEKAGQPRAARARLGQIVTTLRGLLGPGRADWDGHPLELSNRPAAGSRVIVLASGPKLLELAGEVADGVMMLVGLDPGSVEAARQCVRRGAERAGRDPASLEEILIVPIGLGDEDEVRRWPRAWFRKDKPWLTYPSASNLRWLREAGIDLAEDFDPGSLDDELVDRILDAFGLFGSPEHCAERLLRARDEVGLQRVFLFPTHTWEDHYHLPEDEVEAFGRVIGPMLAAGGTAPADRGASTTSKETA